MHFLKRALLMVTLVGAGTPMLPAQDGEQAVRDAVDRSNRLRQHEQKIKEIIERRRIEQMEREKKEREAQQQAAPQVPVEGVAPAPPPEEKKKIALSTAILGFKFVNDEGMSDYNIIVAEGDTFLSEVLMYNLDKNPVDRLRLALDFDKRFIEPVKVFDTELRPQVAGEPSFRVDERDAVLIYDADFAKPLTFDQGVLLRILWRARSSTPYTGISFAFDPLEEPEAIHTAVYVNDNNILGVRNDPADGVLSGGVMVEPARKDKTILQGKGEELKDLYLGSVASDTPVGLAIVGPKEPPLVGQEFQVRVMLNNPMGALVDALDFYVKFDPEVLQVVDSDKFNWITRGVNVNDGPYRENFPWDMHKRNEVRNDRGVINYQMSMSNGGALPSKTVAAITFVAVAPTAGTELGFVKGRPQDQWHSSVRYFGYERLDLEGEVSKPALRLPVLPAPVQLAAETKPKNEAETVSAADTKVRALTIERE